tara:strand:- start:13815 stop:14558 length:744 start_codon:yes stop_codon:yes gene_type:complete
MSTELTTEQVADLVAIKKLAIQYGKKIESALITLIVSIMETLQDPKWSKITVRQFSSYMAKVAMDNQESDYLKRSQLTKYLAIANAFNAWKLTAKDVEKTFSKEKAGLTVTDAYQLCKVDRQKKQVQTKAKFTAFVNKMNNLKDADKRKKAMEDKLLEINPPSAPQEPTEPTEEPKQDVGETKEVLSNTGELHLKARITEVFEDLANGDVPSIITEDSNSKLAIAFRSFINEASQNAEVYLDAFATK